MGNDVWSSEWPTKAGYYFFYGVGDSVGGYLKKPEMTLVYFPWDNMIKVDHVISGLRKETTKGLWAKAFPPDLHIE